VIVGGNQESKEAQMSTRSRLISARGLGLVVLLVCICQAGRAVAQAQLADDIILLSKGQNASQEVRTAPHLGQSGGAFLSDPGGQTPLLGEPTESLRTSRLASRSVLSFAAAGSLQAYQPAGEPIRTPPPIRGNAGLPATGILELPTKEDEGPPDGLDLDTAIELVTFRNLDLQTKFRELPQADADILSAGLRSNPLVFASADDIPYGSYSPARPGENGYGVTVIQAIDANRKRPVRVMAARQARRVLDAQYQDAVRLEIDELYAAFVDVLAARDTVRYFQAGMSALDEAIEKLTTGVKQGDRSELDLERAQLQRHTTVLALEDANTVHVDARLRLAILTGIKHETHHLPEVRGRIRTEVVQLPVCDDLVGLAIATRPDLMAFRLGVQRAVADVRLAQKEAYPDVFVLYTPFGYQNNTPTGGQDATSWSLGVMATVPLLNRNQGNIRRAQINVSQSQLEVAAVEQRIAQEVVSTYREYETATAAVARYDQSVLPLATGLRTRALRLFELDETSAFDVLTARQEYSDIIRKYRDALIRQRRAALRMNTVIGTRIIP